MRANKGRATDRTLVERSWEDRKKRLGLVEDGDKKEGMTYKAGKGWIDDDTGALVV